MGKFHFMNDFFLQTERIGLRKFRPADLDAFASINADPHVMEFFPNRLSRFESQEYMDRINAKIQQQGFGFWAAENDLLKICFFLSLHIEIQLKFHT